MINTIDLRECEVLLPGQWIRVGSGEVYSFTSENMQLRDERLFKQLYIYKQGSADRRPLPYALTIKDDYCGILVGDREYIILRIASQTDGSAIMEWRDKLGRVIKFERTP
jgi:hypothetical protein